MSWAGIANNQAVTRDNLINAVATGVFTAKTSIPAGSKCITKSEASSYVNIIESYAPFANKASNQLVVKSNLQAVSISSILIVNNASYSTTSLYCQTNIGGNSGYYDYIIGRVTATLKDQNGNTITNNLGYTVYVGLSATANGCYGGTVPFSIGITNGSSSNFVQYDAQIVDNCGDPDRFACTFNTITMECVTATTNTYDINGSSNLNWCTVPTNCDDCGGCCN